MKKRKYAIIEIGSNNTKTHIYEGNYLILENNTTIEFKKHYQQNKQISSEDLEKLYAVIEKMREYTLNLHIYGCSIFRNMSTDELAKINQELERRFSLSIEVVTQEQEAEYTALGCYYGLNYKKNICIFIGGGGLGYLVFSGIRTVNNYQILAGAIPACLLALTVDYLIGIIEKLVTPISLQKGKNIDKKLLKKKRLHQKIILIVSTVILLIIFAFTYFTSNKNTDAIVVGSKDFTEQNVLCYMVSDAIKDKTGYDVIENCNLGGTQVCFEALKRGDIDLYIDYTGTVYGDTLNYEPITDIEEVYNTVKDDLANNYNLIVLEQMGFNNTYTLAVKRETAEQYNLKTMSDLARVSRNMIISPSLEFINREDGLDRVNSVYGYSFKDVIGIDGSPRYTALINNESDVVDAFATDGLLKKFNLVVLEDDKNAFPPYYAIPIVRNETLEKYPEIEGVLTSLGSKLNNDIMSELNYQVDELGENPRDVAREFLDSIDF